MTWKIRPAREDDVPRIKVIEEGSFPRPWDEDLFRIIGAWRGCVPIDLNRVISSVGGGREQQVWTHPQHRNPAREQKTGSRFDSP
ncbi:MAG: hypothetical protein ACXADS_12360 [Candidatus Thorarchaeota archaeon]